jgi:hypothetical protein
MKFKIAKDYLSERLLTEEKFYKITVNNDNTYLPMYFIGSNSKDILNYNTASQVYDYITRQFKNKEKVNTALLNDLGKLGNSEITISDISSSYNNFIKHPIYKKRLLNNTFSTSRHTSNEKVKNQVSLDNLIVHHIDEVEYNNSEDNLVGFTTDSLHKLTHLLNVKNQSVGSVEWAGQLPVVIYDGNKFVVKQCKINIKI